LLKKVSPVHKAGWFLVTSFWLLVSGCWFLKLRSDCEYEELQTGNQRRETEYTYLNYLMNDHADEAENNQEQNKQR
jgi:hypothetical protein